LNGLIHYLVGVNPQKLKETLDSLIETYTVLHQALSLLAIALFALVLIQLLSVLFVVFKEFICKKQDN
jgi:hypothetical protein